MTLQDAISRGQLKATKMVGVEATLVDPRGTYLVNGTVTEGPVEYAVWATSMDESRQWADPSVSGTVYVSARDVPAKPQPGWRLKHNGRVFTVIAVLPSSTNGVVYQWRLDVGEVAA